MNDFSRIGFDEESEDGLSLVRWAFYLLDSGYVLDCCYVRARPTKRHKFVTTKFYERLRSRDSIPLSEVPFDDAVRAKVRAQILEVAKVVPILAEGSL